MPLKHGNMLNCWVKWLGVACRCGNACSQNIIGIAQKTNYCMNVDLHSYDP